MTARQDQPPQVASAALAPHGAPRPGTPFARASHRAHRDAGAPDAGALDAGEVARFGALADEWWRPSGALKPLHRVNPLRVAWLRDRLCERFGRDPAAPRPLDGLTIVDVGCGGGLLSEPLARLGAAVTGLDPAAANVAVARAHAAAGGLAIDYRVGTAEALSREAQGAFLGAFDAAVALEVIEHAPRPRELVAALGALARPGGLVALSTLNRTARSYALAIVAAEWVLGWLPRGTHDWARFVTPEEMEAHLASAGLRPIAAHGMTFHPLADEWRLSRDLSVNYLMAAGKPLPEDDVR